MSKIGYMCLTDFRYELGGNPGGIKIFESVEDCQKNKKCVGPTGGCGIVKVQIIVIDTVIEEDWKRELGDD